MLSMWYDRPDAMKIPPSCDAVNIRMNERLICCNLTVAYGIIELGIAIDRKARKEIVGGLVPREAEPPKDQENFQRLPQTVHSQKVVCILD